MRPNDPGIRCYFGVSGSGKTYTMQLDVFDAVRAGVPVLVVDANNEWKKIPPDVRRWARSARSLDDARRAFSGGYRLVVWSLPIGADVGQAVEGACRWAIERPGVAGIALAEAHEAAPNIAVTALPPYLRHCATRWRHSDVAMWLDTQRIAALCHGLTDNARELRIFATVGDIDYNRLRTIGGKELVSAVQVCTQKLSDYTTGKDPNGRGWHVKLGLTRLGPYTPVRA
jgi:hypothetical protein